MLHGSPGFERGKNRVGVDRRASEDLVPKRIREGVQDGSTAAPNGRLADAASADRRLRIGNIERGPLHIDRYIQDGGRLALGEPRRKHGAVVGVVYPLLPNRMADAQNRAAEDLAAQRTGMDYGTNVGASQEIQDVVLSRFDVDFDLGETGDIGKGRAVVRSEEHTSE